MKICIFTLPLHTNYGGIIQATALKTYLESKGHEVWLLDRKKGNLNIISHIFFVIKKGVRRFVLREKNISFKKKTLSPEEVAINRNSQAFIDKYLNKKTEPFYSSHQLTTKFDSYNFDLCIVGSDQVWRPAYTPQITDYFGCFLKKNTKTRIISYAASFGTDKPELSKSRLNICKSGIQKFTAVSVRESSGVVFCKNELSVDATHVLDPTMLLNKSDYIKIIESSKVKKHSGQLMTYILDYSEEKKKVIDLLSDTLKYEVFSTIPKYGDKHNIQPLDEDQFKLEFWLRGFYDASLTVTDSFHACVFSIIFNKPFIVYGNKQRGVARFQSLLQMFNLEDQYIESGNELINVDKFFTIDWVRVNNIWEEKKLLSEKFLHHQLKQL